MTKRYKLTYTLAAIVALIVFCFSSLTVDGARIARAATIVSGSYEQSNVLDDLKGSIVDGKEFDLKTYNFDNNKRTQLLSFIEFCYSFDRNNQQDFGLYVYVYNPQGINYDTNSESNQIRFRYGDFESDSFNKYRLRFLNQSTAAGCEGLFYKYKIVLSEAQRKDILNTVNSAERIYEVSEIELLIKGDYNATAYDVSKKYIYAGYAEGYGSVTAEGDSLTCTSEGTTTLTLDVHPATYRLDGSNGTNNYTQDSLDSVYFAVPNEILAEYGGLSAVHATWLNVWTAPVFVTGNKAIFDDLYPIVWNYSGDLTKAAENGLNFDYCWSANARQYVHADEWIGDVYYGDTPKIWLDGTGDPDKSKYLDNLYYIFFADGGKADSYELNGTKVLEYIRSYTKHSGSNSDLVAGKYLSELFETIDDKPTDINIHADDKYSLIGEKLTQNWWQKLFGMAGTEIASRTTFKNIEAIHQVVDSDFTSNIAATCKGLFIGESYYDDFKEFYDRSTQRNETVYILRYFQGDYQSREVTEFSYGSLWGYPKTKLNKIDTNAFCAQAWLHINFDIIDVTCTKGNVRTVLGVVASPRDFAPPFTPPLNTTPDISNWWKYAIGISVALVVFYVGYTVVRIAIKKYKSRG